MSNQRFVSRGLLISLVPSLIALSQPLAAAETAKSSLAPRHGNVLLEREGESAEKDYLVAYRQMRAAIDSQNYRAAKSFVDEAISLAANEYGFDHKTVVALRIIRLDIQGQLATEPSTTIADEKDLVPSLASAVFGELSDEHLKAESAAIMVERRT